jgi:hypothetical protein
MTTEQIRSLIAVAGQAYRKRDEKRKEDITEKNSNVPNITQHQKLLYVMARILERMSENWTASVV